MTTDESIKQAIEELAIAEQALGDAKRKLSELKKPLTWPKLPNLSMFSFDATRRSAVYKASICLVCDGKFFQYNRLIGKFYGPFECRREEPVTRINLDGTPYEGDPRV